VTRPGITSFDSFKKGDIVVIKDEVHSKPLAVGIALIDGDKAVAEQKGYVIQTLHYISDKIWEAHKLLDV
jgi:PUA domain protein